MAGEEDKLLRERTIQLSVRVFKEDFAAFERLQKALGEIKADQLGRILWRIVIWKSPELVADIMRLALEGREGPGPPTTGPTDLPPGESGAANDDET
jgi:hypothetical protein